MQQYYDVRRDTAHEARARLLRNEATQGSDSVSLYLQKFRDVVREATDMSEIDQIWWFLNGLNTQLQRWCRADETGQDWKTFDAMLAYVYGQETRQNYTRKPSANAVKTNKNPSARLHAVNAPKFKKQNKHGAKRSSVHFGGGASGSNGGDKNGHVTCGYCKEVFSSGGNEALCVHWGKRGGPIKCRELIRKTKAGETYGLPMWARN